MPAGWPPSHPNPDPAPKQEADAAGLRDNTESPTMRRNVLLLFWALYRLKCGDTVEVRHAPRATPTPRPAAEPDAMRHCSPAQPSPVTEPEPRAPSPSPALTGRSTPVLEASHRQPSHPYQVDAMSEQQLQRAKQLATKVLIQPSP